MKSNRRYQTPRVPSKSMRSGVGSFCAATRASYHARAAAHAMHVLAQQVMALILQEGGISWHKLMPWVEAAYPFSSVCPDRVQELNDTMLDSEVLYEACRLLSFAGDLRSIIDVLSGVVPLKVIHNARFERRVPVAMGISFYGIFDTLETSGRARGAGALGGYNLAMVCERERSIVLDKASQTSNSSRRPPNADQLDFALDAEVLLALQERFKDVGRTPGPLRAGNAARTYFWGSA